MEQIGLKEKEQDTESTAHQLGLGYINLVGFPIGPETISALPREEAERLKTVCFLKTLGQIRLGTVNPEHPDIPPLMAALGTKYHAQVELYVVSEHGFLTAMRLYDRLPKVRKVTSDVEIVSSDLERLQGKVQNLKDLDAQIKTTSVTDTFILLLAGALQSRACS